MKSEKTIIPDLIFDRDETGTGARMYAYTKAFGRALGIAKSDDGAGKSSALEKELEKTKLAVGENV